ncbi:hypothetical protein Hanom_Chr02g00096491 [Helianthus anomalus]
MMMMMVMMMMMMMMLESLISMKILYVGCHQHTNNTWGFIGKIKNINNNK